MTSSPVIITGMHRSGTSLLASLLQAGGLYLGKRVDRHLESRFHSRINKRILSDLACNWANPAGIAECLMQETNLRNALEFTDACLSTWVYRNYSQPGTDTAWGWKDPKTTLTLPVWLKRYPQATVVHIRRHGIDVALSLMNRAEGRARTRRISHRPRRAYHFAGSAHSELYDGRFASLHNGLSLWDEYLTCFARYRAAGMAGKHVIEIDYERLLNNPAETAMKLIQNLGLAGAVEDDIGSSVNPDRAFSWTRSEDARLKQLLSEHHDVVGELLSRHGYGLDDSLFRSVDNTSDTSR